MKKVGIVVDNYKVNRFKSELTKKGFTDIELHAFTKDCTTIRINVQDDQVSAVHAICIKIESDLKRAN